MATPPTPLHGDALLAAVTDALVELHQRYYHRPPATAKTQWMGSDLLACVLGGVYTDVEKTLIELERAPLVQDNRNAFQIAMADRFIAAVEWLCGRRVVHFISSHNVGPDLEVELFFLADSPPQTPDRAGEIAAAR
jgi:uncharacterized protein YbcI